MPSRGETAISGFSSGTLARSCSTTRPPCRPRLAYLLAVHYNLRPVSLYGGMVNLPLIVTRPDGATFFSDDELHQLNDGRLWVEADTDRYELGGLMADLRDNVLGAHTWAALEPQARTFIATGERLMRDHRRDAAFDFPAALMELAKAVEVQVNATLAAAMKGAPAATLHANVDGASVDLSRRTSLSLAQLARVIAGDRERADGLVKSLEKGAWFVASLPPVLTQLAEYRNAAAHSGRLTREVAGPLREQIVGIGCVGTMTELAGVRLRRR